MSRCVFFLFEHSLTGQGFDGPWGTGFFVVRKSECLHGPFFHYYAVSNRHVVNPSSTIRVNTKSGSVFYIERDIAQWTYSDTDDLAVVDVTEDLTCRDSELAVSAISETQFVRRELLEHSACLGDQTIMLGLFVDHDGGSEINLPVARFGNMAATPNSKVPVLLYKGDTYERPAFLNDMRSRTGFSGSPVWTWYNPYDSMANDPGNDSQFGSSFKPRASLTLVGVHRGQFREPASIIRDLPPEPESKEDEINVASSMTVVIPAWEITTLLNKPELQSQRSARDARPDRIAAAIEYGGIIGAEETSRRPMKIQFPPQNFVNPLDYY